MIDREIEKIISEALIHLPPDDSEYLLAQAYRELLQKSEQLERKLEVAVDKIENIIAVDHYGTAGELARMALKEIEGMK